jgi:hypothetical protein
VQFFCEMGDREVTLPIGIEGLAQFHTPSLSPQPAPNGTETVEILFEWPFDCARRGVRAKNNLASGGVEVLL